MCTLQLFCHFIIIRLELGSAAMQELQHYDAPKPKAYLNAATHIASTPYTRCVSNLSNPLVVLYTSV